MSKKNIVRTSSKIASKASKVLRSSEDTEVSKAIAGSALGNRISRK